MPETNTQTEIEKQNRRIQVTTIFAARLAAALCNANAFGVAEVRTILADLKPGKPSLRDLPALTELERTLSVTQGVQVDTLEREFNSHVSEKS